MSVLRYSTEANKRLKFQGVPAQVDYSTAFNGVDRLDRSNSDWSVSVRTHRYYFRIFFWLFDASLHNMWNIAIRTKDEWDRKFSRQNAGHCKFLVDAALELMNFAIRLDWKKGGNPDDPNDNGSPAWMRQLVLIPCDCGAYFFCKTGRTNGVAHVTVTVPPPPLQVPQQCSSERKVI